MGNLNISIYGESKIAIDYFEGLDIIVYNIKMTINI
jgi:hypothetical protein